MKSNYRWAGPVEHFACGFLAYYLRYGNQWQDNEIRLAYNVLFGTFNLIGWCLEWVWFNAPLAQGMIVLGALTIIVGFFWIFGIPPLRRRFRF